MTNETPQRSRRYFVVGGAGFIGSHLVDRLLTLPGTERVSVFDNFSSGHPAHLEHHEGDGRLVVVKGDARQLDALLDIMPGHDTVIHLASNPDIARAVEEPTIDFDAGTLITAHVVESARRTGVSEIWYASGSGVYGDLGEIEASEDTGPRAPVSTYGASKIAGEALISAYSHMFGIRGRAFRFGNVVGPRQTHGVGFDFLRRLQSDPSRLVILGDGRQSKSYIHVDDVLRALLVASEKETASYAVYNVATGDYITVTEIAELVVDCLGLDRTSVSLEYTGGERGWPGDVPVVRLNCDRIRGLGWRCEHRSKDAMRKALTSMAARPSFTSKI